MTPELIVDGLIALVCLTMAWSGWRQGFISSGLSFIGVASGIIVGMAAAPLVMELTDQVALRFLLAIGVLILLVGLGQLIGSSIGAGLRNQMRTRGKQRVDSFFGAIFQAMATLSLIHI